MSLRGVYIPHFDQISVFKKSVLVVLYPYRCIDGGEIWHHWGDWHGAMPNFTPMVQRVALAGRKTSKSASE